MILRISTSYTNILIIDLLYAAKKERCEVMKNRKMLIFSDSHGRVTAMRDILELHRGSVDCVAFLGDGARDFELLRLSYDFPCDFISVRGNCDMGFLDIPEDRFIDFYGYKIYLTHGYSLNVKYGLERLEYKCRELGADVGLFGHTHYKNETYILPDERYEKQLILFNPGSITLPNDDKPSFGLLTVSGGNILLSHGTYSG